MDKILFRCSGVGALLTKPRNKSEVLSETAKSLIHAMWLDYTYGYREYINNEYMDKGLKMEQDSMALVQKVLGGAFRIKNREKLKNEYLIGTPDIILADTVEDIKTCWSLRTFFEAEPTTMYIAQAQAYMALTGKHEYRLIYSLIPNTKDMIINECERLVYKFNREYENADYIEQCQQIQRNNDLINDLPISDRVKVFELKYDADMIAEMYSKIEQGREYYSTLKLTKK